MNRRSPFRREVSRNHDTRSKDLVFDSGLGGLTFSRGRQNPALTLISSIVLTTPGFPTVPERRRTRRARSRRHGVAHLHGVPDIVAIACNTASTLVLSQLRARWTKLPFVGTCRRSSRRRKSLKQSSFPCSRHLGRWLATTRKGLSRNSLAIAADAGWHQGISQGLRRGPCMAKKSRTLKFLRKFALFSARIGRAHDAVVLACTHYPLLAEEFARLAPWPVLGSIPPGHSPPCRSGAFGSFGPDAPIKSEPAVGVRDGRALFTSGEAPTATLAKVLARYGLSPSESSALAETP